MIKAFKDFFSAVYLIFLATVMIFLLFFLSILIIEGPRKWEQESIIKHKLIVYKQSVFVIDKIHLVNKCSKCHN